MNKLNIGYFSADFRDHAVGHLIARMLECHDKSKFKIFCIGKEKPFFLLFKIV